MRYLITGGAGFIGSHLADQLLARGDRVLALDDLSTGSSGNIVHLSDHPGFVFVRGTILDHPLVSGLVADCDVVVHLAAAVGVRLIVEKPLESLLTNIRGTEIVLDAVASAGRKVLITSTSEIYGKNASGLCTRTRTESSALPSRPAGPTAPRKPSTRSWPVRTGETEESPRSLFVCSTASVLGRRASSGWSSHASFARARREGHHGVRRRPAATVFLSRARYGRRAHRGP